MSDSSPAAPLTRRFGRQTPWFLIAVLAHGAVIAVASVLYFGHDTVVDDDAPIGLRLAAATPPPVDIQEPVIVPRDEVPKMRDLEQIPDHQDFEPELSHDPAPSESDAETTVPYPDADPRGKAGGATAIGTVGFARYAPPSPFGGPPGGKYDVRFHKSGTPGPRGHTPAPVQNSVRCGLDWLQRHQDDDGRWDADKFMKHDQQGDACTGPGNGAHDVGVTGLALLAFLGEGNTLRDGSYRTVVRKGVRWLLAQQGESGLIGAPTSQGYMYSHAIATLALCEAYGLSQYRPMQRATQAAVSFITNARNPYGVWRYEPRPADGDTSVSAWMVQALLSAKEFELAVDDTALRTAMVWFESVTDPATGVVGYTKAGEGSSRPVGKQDVFPAAKTEALTSAVLLCRCLSHDAPADQPAVKRATTAVLAKLPTWNDKDGSIDMYYWYYGSYAMFQVGGKAWETWAKSLNAAAVKTQRADGNSKGSWDPVDAWGEEGGRVYSTAMMVLCLEAYYRYGRVFGAR